MLQKDHSSFAKACKGIVKFFPQDLQRESLPWFKMHKENDGARINPSERET